MNEKDVRELRCTVRTDTSYGKKVMKCVDVLKDRTGLTVTNLIQEALILYEKTTRENDELPVDSLIEKNNQELTEIDIAKESKNTYNSLLTLSANEEGIY